MHINDDHMYHGAALTQIADRPEFKAINAFKDINARGAFRINDDIGVYIKHALAPTKSVHREYVFTFNKKALADVEEIKKRCAKVFVVFVCVKDKEICAIPAGQFEHHIQNRKDAEANAYLPPATQYQVLVTAKPGEKFRVYVNKPQTRNKMLGEQRVSRNAFPQLLFAKQP